MADTMFNFITMFKRKPMTNADRMANVKARCEKARTGPKKTAALKHYRSAEEAHTKNNSAKVARSLRAAELALK